MTDLCVLDMFPQSCPPRRTEIVQVRELVVRGPYYVGVPPLYDEVLTVTSSSSSYVVTTSSTSCTTSWVDPALTGFHSPANTLRCVRPSPS